MQVTTGLREMKVQKDHPVLKNSLKSTKTADIVSLENTTSNKRWGGCKIKQKGKWKE